jgi:hypothetical protein
MKILNILLWIFITTNAFISNALAADETTIPEQPIVRITLEGDQPVHVGQQLRVNIELLVPNFFMSAPQWPTLDIPDAITTLSEGSAANRSEIIAGATYAGIVQTYIVVPQRDGDFELPPAAINFSYAAIPGQATQGSVTLPPTKFTAIGSNTTQPMAKVTVTQTLDRKPDDLKVGDAITRTLDVYADHTQAMMIPPPVFDALDNVQIHRHDPILTDVNKDRIGFVGGRRIDSATYIFEKSGSYQLPAIAFKWFNTETDQYENASAPAITLSIAANSAWKPDIAPDAVPTEHKAITSQKIYSLLKPVLLVIAIILLGYLIYVKKTWLLEKIWLIRKAYRATFKSTTLPDSLNP